MGSKLVIDQRQSRKVKIENSSGALTAHLHHFKVFDCDTKWTERDTSLRY